MKVRYTKIPDLLNPGKHSWHPLVQVCVRNRARSFLIHGIVDSGAVDCVFPAELGERLGIDVTAGQPTTYFGFAGQGTIGFRHLIELRATGLQQWFSVEVGFVANELIPLLGQDGFFSNYQIIFERFRYQLEIHTRTSALIRRGKGY